MVPDLEQLGRALTSLDVSELTMLPRFTAADAARWPAVLSDRPRTVACVVAADHDAELSTTIGHPHSGEPHRWLDLCISHAEQLNHRFGYRVDTTRRSAEPDADPATTPGDGATHPLAAMVSDAADGRRDPDAPAVDVLGPLPGPCDVVLFLPGQIVVAADLDAGWVHEEVGRRRDHDPTDAVAPWGSFVAAVAARLGDPAVQVGLLTAASHRAPMLRGGLTLGGEPDPGWSPYRSTVRTYRYRSTSTEGHIDIGHGPAERVEVYPRLRIARQSGGAPSREVVAAARSLAPDAHHVFGSAPLHDSDAIRVLLDAAFTPVGTEALFLTRPRPASRSRDERQEPPAEPREG